MPPVKRTYFLSGAVMSAAISTSLPLAAEVHRALLNVVVVDHLLVLVPHKIALRGVKIGCRLVHGVQRRFQVLGVRNGSATKKKPCMTATSRFFMMVLV